MIATHKMVSMLSGLRKNAAIAANEYLDGVATVDPIDRPAAGVRRDALGLMGVGIAGGFNEGNKP